ncbi:putative membrane protein [Hanseniaspora osmophila]|uniref:Putative membrane protein n=1 Tax=Hanseniaspora osmophila TaxID=56408 RepID=A0A1E5R0M4_9ASCO|nr:putative membrane protein [Hanseniaspora osmophila]
MTSEELNSNTTSKTQDNALGPAVQLTDEELSANPEYVLEQTLSTILSRPVVCDEESDVDQETNALFTDDDDGDNADGNQRTSNENNRHKQSDSPQTGLSRWKPTLHKPAPSIYILCSLMSVKVLAENLVLGVITDLTLAKIQKYYEDNERQSQKEFAKFQSVTSVIQGLLGISLCSKYGHLSDNHGRVFVLQICGLLTILGSLANLYIYKDSTTYEFYSFVFFYCIEALNAGQMSMVAVGNSYVSDIVSEDNRMVCISFFMSIMYATIGIGPLVGSFLVKIFKGNSFNTLYVALFLNVSYTLGVEFFLSESRTVNERRESQSQYHNEVLRKNLRKEQAIFSKESSKWSKVYHLLKMDTLIDLFKPLKTLWVPKTALGSLVPRINVLILVIIEMFVGGSVEGSVQAIVTYSMFKYSWSSVEIGYYYSISGVGRALVLLLAVPQLISFLKRRNYVALPDSIDRIDMIHLYLFLIFVITAFASMIVYETNDIGSYLNSLFISLSAFALPTVQNGVIKYASKKSIGQVFAAMAVLRHLMSLIAPPLYLQVYAATAKTFPTLFLYIPIILSALSLVLLQFVKIVKDHDMLRRQSEASFNNFDEHINNYSVNTKPNTSFDIANNLKNGKSNLQSNSIPIETTPLFKKSHFTGKDNIRNSYKSLRNSFVNSNTPSSKNSSLDKLKAQNFSAFNVPPSV